MEESEESVEVSQAVSSFEGNKDRIRTMGFKREREREGGRKIE